MPWPDIIHALQTSVPAALTAMGLTLAALVSAVVRISKAVEDGKRRKDAKSVPPIAPAPALERRLDTLERVVSEQAKWREEELIARVSELEKTLADLGQDQGRMAHAIATERQRAIRAESRLLVELEQRKLLENALAEATYAKEKAERERDAARKAAEAARRG